MLIPKLRIPSQIIINNRTPRYRISGLRISGDVNARLTLTFCILARPYRWYELCSGYPSISDRNRIFPNRRFFRQTLRLPLRVTRSLTVAPPI